MWFEFILWTVNAFVVSIMQIGESSIWSHVSSPFRHTYGFFRDYFFNRRPPTMRRWLWCDCHFCVEPAPHESPKQTTKQVTKQATNQTLQQSPKQTLKQTLKQSTTRIPKLPKDSFIQEGESVQATNKSNTQLSLQENINDYQATYYLRSGEGSTIGKLILKENPVIVNNPNKPRTVGLFVGPSNTPSSILPIGQSSPSFGPSTSHRDTPAIDHSSDPLMVHSKTPPTDVSFGSYKDHSGTPPIDLFKDANKGKVRRGRYKH